MSFQFTVPLVARLFEFLPRIIAVTSFESWNETTDTTGLVKPNWLVVRIRDERRIIPTRITV